MFDSLLGGKFSNKCKHAIKCINSRVVPIRKKKQAMLRFLRKDVADLLASGHDSNAFGRIDALIVEINRTSCYDMVEQYCECIANQLPSLRKQRECPEEAMEPVSTLIFAAARFSDLPELCDLRHVCAMRYGSHMESSVNAEFVEKIQKKSFSKEKKLQLMQEIADEYSINWDFKKFANKISNPEVPSDKTKRSSSMSNGYDEPSHRLPDGRNEKVAEVPHQEIPYRGKCEPTPRDTIPELQTESKDIHVIVNNGRVHDSSRKTKKVFTVESENVKPSFNDFAPPLDVKLKEERIVTDRYDVHEVSAHKRSLNVSEEQKYNGVVKQTNGLAQSLNDKGAYKVPPYTKPKESKNGSGTPVKEQHDDGLPHCRLSMVEGEPDPIGQDRQPVRPVNLKNDRLGAMIPPYLKPKGSSVAAAIDRAKQADVPTQHPAAAGYDMSNGGKGNLKDDFSGDVEKPRPRSVRKKNTRIPPVVGDDNAGGMDDLVNEAPSSRIRQVGRQRMITHDDDEVDNAIDYGKLLIRTPSDRGRRKASMQSSAAYDDHPDEIVDQLLIHYSKKGIPNKPVKTGTVSKVHHADHVVPDVEVSVHQNKHERPAESVHLRAISLPPEPINPSEVVKGPARAASMHPDLLSPNTGRVHPRLPDYDELAARFIALKKA